MNQNLSNSRFITFRSKSNKSEAKKYWNWARTFRGDARNVKFFADDWQKTDDQRISLVTCESESLTLLDNSFSHFFCHFLSFLLSAASSFSCKFKIRHYDNYKSITKYFDLRLDIIFFQWSVKKTNKRSWNDLDAHHDMI